MKSGISERTVAPRLEPSYRRCFIRFTRAAALLFCLLVANHTSAQIFIGDFENTVNVYSTSGALINSFKAPGYVEALATNSNGALLMADGVGRMGYGYLDEFTLLGAPVMTPLIAGVAPTPNCLAVVGTNIFMINGDYLTQFAQDGTVINTLVYGEGTLAYDPAGYLFIARRSDNAIGKYGLDGTVINDSLITGLPGTNDIFFGMAIDNSGHLFVACPGTGTIAEYTTSGALINASLVSGLDFPYAISLDESNNLFVLNYYSGIVGEYTSSGATVNAALLTNNSTFTMSMLVVPPITNPPQFTSFSRLANGLFQFGIGGAPGTNFSLLASTNLTLPMSNWTVLNTVTQVSPGRFQFSDPAMSNSLQGFYRLRWP